MMQLKNSKLDELSEVYRKTHRKTCAAVTFGFGQKIFYIVIVTGLLLLLKIRWDIALFLVSGFLLILYLAAILLKLAAAWLCLFGDCVHRISKKQMESITVFPVYTILIPLYHEPEIAGKILKRLKKLKYPKSKLDVKILLEKDDSITLNVLKETDLPSWCSILIAPESVIKTKPRACNYGLREARGEYCVIFDAEDIPEPDQLLKVLYVFNQDTDKRIACVQAKLNYFNSKQNWLTKFFTIEYTTYFDLVLGGWNKFGIPLPLGGTSNHFRTEYLRKLGGWDPFNVTEDCELGIRIYEDGWKTAVVESTTWEEANSRPGNWLRQRSRWVKGFIQTHLAHCRHPLTTIRKLGIWGAFGSYLSVGGGSLMMLTNVIFWPLTVFYLVMLAVGTCHGESIASQIFVSNSMEKIVTGINVFGFILKPWPLIYSGVGESLFWSTFSKVSFGCSLFLLLSNVLLVIVHAAACIRRKFYHLLPFSLLMPVYWMMISAGAWKGFWQIFTKPHFWEKTVHGLDQKDNEK